MNVGKARIKELEFLDGGRRNGSLPYLLYWKSYSCHIEICGRPLNLK